MVGAGDDDGPRASRASLSRRFSVTNAEGARGEVTGHSWSALRLAGCARAGQRAAEPMPNFRGGWGAEAHWRENGATGDATGLACATSSPLAAIPASAWRRGNAPRELKMHTHSLSPPFPFATATASLPLRYTRTRTLPPQEPPRAPALRWKCPEEATSGPKRPVLRPSGALFAAFGPPHPGGCGRAALAAPLQARRQGGVAWRRAPGPIAPKRGGSPKRGESWQLRQQVLMGVGGWAGAGHAGHEQTRAGWPRSPSVAQQHSPLLAQAGERTYLALPPRRGGSGGVVLVWVLREGEHRVAGNSPAFCRAGADTWALAALESMLPFDRTAHSSSATAPGQSKCSRTSVAGHRAGVEKAGVVSEACWPAGEEAKLQPSEASCSRSLRGRQEENLDGPQ
eukprot:scaffold3166_cov399-Prasinococcus_capsulatus_cf.AAC.29